MRIAISGSSGFIARYLADSFTKCGYEVVPIARALLAPENSLALSELIQTADVVVNLAGANIGQRWTRAHKQLIRDSRVNSTRAIVSAINRLSQKPSLLISVSGVGIYGFDAIGDETNQQYGDDFLATVCHDWEAEAQKVSPDVRLVIPRLGVVLCKNEGAFPRIAAPFRYGLGGHVASGRQGFPWIHITDVVSAFHLIISNTTVSGPVNLTAPDIIDNEQLANVLGQFSSMPAWLPVPAFALRWLLGEQSDLVIKGQKIYPGKLFNLGFHFRHPSIESAVSHLLND